MLMFFQNGFVFLIKYPPTSKCMWVSTHYSVSRVEIFIGVELIKKHYDINRNKHKI